MSSGPTSTAAMSPEQCRMEDSAVISCCPDLTVTIRKKMNSFKKFKRRMGLGEYPQLQII